MYKKTIIFLLFLFCLQFFIGADVSAAAIGESCQNNSECEGANVFCLPKICPIILCPGEKVCTYSASPDILPSKIQTKSIDFTPAVKIPGIDIVGVDGKGVALATYISGFYKFAIGLTGILATVMIAIGGITWLTAGGAAGQIGKAKQMIGGSLVGLVLALFSYTILWNVNPDIVALKFPKAGVGLVSKIEPGCGWGQVQCNEIENMIEKDTNSCGGDEDKHPGEYCCCIVDGCCYALGARGSVALRMSKGRILHCVDSVNENLCEDIINDFIVGATQFHSKEFRFDKTQGCEKIKGCSQFCQEMGDGTDCSNYDLNGICENGQCVLDTT